MNDDQEPPFEDNDGFRIRDFYEDGVNQLWLEIKFGEMVQTDYSVVAYRNQGDDPKTLGELQRNRCLLEAAARFLNAGGTQEELLCAMDVFKCGELPQIDLPGHYLLATIQEVDAPTHIFLSEDDEETAIVWEEDNYVEYMTLDQVAEQFGEEEDEEDEDDQSDVLDTPCTGSEDEVTDMSSDPPLLEYGSAGEGEL